MISVAGKTQKYQVKEGDTSELFLCWNSNNYY